MISPVAFELFGYEVRWYSLLILIYSWWFNSRFNYSYSILSQI